MFWNVYHIHSSLVASRATHDDMLAFAARQGVKPKVELYEHKGAETVNEIFEKLTQNKVRYRAVLVK
jgi:D-arabinose 1-dehydrogenase-like Zn-dependent alcohol dehydrogenase